MPKVGKKRSHSSAFYSTPVEAGDFNYDPKVSVETSQKSFRDSWIRPIGGVSNQNGPFTFVIEPMVDQYIQLNRAMLEVKCRVVKENGSSLHEVEDIVAPVNLLGSCMWDQVDVELNGQPFSGSSAINVPYKSQFETLLSYDADSYNTHLQTQLFHLDSPQDYEVMKVSHERFRETVFDAIANGTYAGPTYGDDDKLADGYEYLDRARTESVQVGFQADLEELYDDATLTAQVAKMSSRKTIFDAWLKNYITGRMAGLIAIKGRDRYNKGFGYRYDIVRGSAQFDMYSPIPHDFFKINNNVGPGNRIVIRMTMAKPEFLLNSKSNVRYKIELLDMRMHIHTIERRERIPHPMIERYFMTETQMGRQIVALNSPGATFRIHHGGIMPKNIVIGMVPTEAADGRYKLNPFNLQNFNVTNMALLINGEKYPSTGLEFDFEKANALVCRAYYWLFENTGVWTQEKGNVVSWQAFRDGCFIVPFDLTPDKCNSLHNHISEEGYIDIEMKFREPLAQPIYVYSLMCYPKMVVNDHQTNSVTTFHLGDLGNIN